jgi:hypothetical protein
MGVTNRFGHYGVLFDTTLIGGITNVNVDTGTDTRGEAQSDEVTPRIQSIVAQRPSASFGCQDIAAIIGEVGVSGVDIATLGAGLVLYARKHADGGTRAAGAAHRAYTINDGMVLPRSLSVEHRGDAELSCDVLIKYDGTNAPIVETDGETLPSWGTPPIYENRWTLGGVTIGGVALTGVRGVDVDFGIQADTEGADGDIWDTFASIRRINPTITIRGVDMEWLDSAAVTFAQGLAGTHANTEIWLKRRLHTGVFDLDATTVHILITAAGLWTVGNAFSSSGAEAATIDLMCAAYNDGTNDPVKIQTGQAIT